jgi:hypothetical protein
MKLKQVSAASWASTEYLFYPLLMILATPFLIRNLGAGPFGLSMLVATMVGSWGVVNFGSSPMITRFIAVHQHGTEPEHLKRIVRFGLGRALAGVFLALILRLKILAFLKKLWSVNKRLLMA